MLPKKYTECAFGNKNKICADEWTIAAMKKMLLNINANYVADQPAPTIVEDAKDHLQCNSESCVISHPEFIKVVGKYKANEIKNRQFKPHGPRNTTEWLSNNNIDHVIKQWAETDNARQHNFLHIPFQMRDFKKTNSELARTNMVEEYKKGMRKFAVVLNTDYSSGGGKHWVCIFGDFDRQDGTSTLEYFNSSGVLPFYEACEWLHETRQFFWDQLQKKIILVNVVKTVLQKSNSECGVFCLAYIYCRLNNYDYTIFGRPNALTDKEMYEFRQFLFRTTK